MHVALVTNDEELEVILRLQRANVATALSVAQALAQGFVTVTHSLDVLRAMHALAPSVIAKHDHEVIGYALMMPVATRTLVPILGPMFQLLDGLVWRGVALAQHRFYVMGQICIAQDWRARGVFDALYEGHRRYYAADYDCVVTEVATRNQRSLRAHARVGFKSLHRYRDAIDEWEVIAWDFEPSHDRAHTE